MKNYVVTSNSASPLSLFDPFFDSFFFDRNENVSRYLNADIWEDDKQYHIDMDLPRVNKEDIKISLENGYLVLNATQKKSFDKNKERYLSKERYYGTLSREFYIGDDVKEEDISASLNSGVLTININKVKPQKIEKKYISIE